MWTHPDGSLCLDQLNDVASLYASDRFDLHDFAVGRAGQKIGGAEHNNLAHRWVPVTVHNPLMQLGAVARINDLTVRHALY